VKILVTSEVPWLPVAGFDQSSRAPTCSCGLVFNRRILSPSRSRSVAESCTVASERIDLRVSVAGHKAEAKHGRKEQIPAFHFLVPPDERLCYSLEEEGGKAYPRGAGGIHDSLG
jgi:hypothetical protein